MRLGRCLPVAVYFSCLLGGIAHANPEAKPDLLFDEGLADMRAGRFELACPKFEHSYQLDPVPGALFTLAECEAAWGKTATALEHYRQFITLLTSLTSEVREKHEQRRQVAFEKMTVLHGLVPRITIVVPSNAPPDMIVERDGQLVNPLSYGVATAVDPGAHSVSVVWGQQRSEQVVLVREKDNARIDVKVPLPPPSRDSEPDPPSDQRLGLAYVAVGTAVAGVGLGAVTGILAVREKRKMDDECVDRLCTAEGRRAVDDGQRYATISTIGFGIGAAAAVGAVLLWPTSSSEQPPTQRPQPGPMLSAAPNGGWVGWAGAF